MKAYARWLFGLAAAANFAVAGLFLFGKGPLVALFGLDPIAGTNLLFVNLAAVLIGGFGYGYARIAADPVAFRPLIHLGAAGKLGAVLAAIVAAIEDPHAIRMAALIGGDAVFAALFLDYLRRTRR
jgi:hypothetical protein